MCNAGVLQHAGAGCYLASELVVRPLVTSPPVIARPTLSIWEPIRFRVLVKRDVEVTATDDDLPSFSAFKSFHAWQPHQQLKTSFLATVWAIRFEHK